MIFNQWFYIVLLISSVILFFIFPRDWRRYVLFFSGIIFYGHFAPVFLALIFFETLLLAILLNKPKFWKSYLAVLICTAILVFFKYRIFISSLINQLSDLVSVGLKLPIYSLAVPLAISFFTFEFIHFVVDRQKSLIAKTNLIQLAAFIFFFPTMVAGPIKRFNNFNEQIELAQLLPEHIFVGTIRLLTGYFKKAVLADTLASLAGNTFTSSFTIAQSSPFALWFSLFSYSFRIYFDFSGYSDIAIGSARLFGIIVPENFIFPYLRSNIADFWKNWHRSLYTWIVDYIYIPLGGSRQGLTAACRNTLIAMAISGLWHGAAIHFIVWGIYHGLLLCSYRIYKSALKNMAVNVNWLIFYPFSTVLTFLLVSIGWLFFITPFPVAFYALFKMLGFLK